MDLLFDFLTRFIGQFQSPALAFLIGGMLLAAFKSKLEIPSAIYQFAVFMLLMRIGMKGGMEIKNANLVDMMIPALASVIIGLSIVAAGSFVLSRLPKIKKEDAIATSGLFGAVSASTLAAAMSLLEENNVMYEAWIAGLYPFMDIPALLLAIILANIYISSKNADTQTRVRIRPIIKESLRSTALSALLLGMALGILTNPEKVFDGFYDPLFRGLLSILMLIMGMEAYARLNEMRKVAHWYLVYGLCAPVIHGFIGFGFGYLAHITTGFSAGGVVLLSVIAASSSDVSGPPTLRAAIPTANPSAYIGTSTSIGTPVAIAICIPLFIALADALIGF
jgi:hypothetical protein